MSGITITERSVYVQTWTMEEEKLLDHIQSTITTPSSVYAVMDHAVTLGVYEAGSIHLGLNRRVQALDSLKYVQELRVFNSSGEFRAIRVDGVFRCRYISDDRDDGDRYAVAVLDETHKLWGAAKQGADHNGWSLLQSNRGTEIYYPDVVQAHGEKGILVRNYIEFREYPPASSPTDDAGGNLYTFMDERLVKFTDWPPTIDRKGEYGK